MFGLRKKIRQLEKQLREYERKGIKDLLSDYSSSFYYLNDGHAAFLTSKEVSNMLEAVAAVKSMQKEIATLKEQVSELPDTVIKLMSAKLENECSTLFHSLLDADCKESLVP